MRGIPIKQKKAWTFLNETPFEELCKFELEDFINAVHEDILPPTTKCDIDYLCKAKLPISDLPIKLYVIAFVYRDTSYLNRIRCEYEKSVFSAQKNHDSAMEPRETNIEKINLKSKIEKEAQFLA